MKITLVVLLITLMFGTFQNGYSQSTKTVQYEKVLLTKYTEKELNEMSKSNPDELVFLNAFVKNGFYIMNSVPAFGWRAFLTVFS